MSFFGSYGRGYGGGGGGSTYRKARSCRPPKPYVGSPLGHCPKSLVGKIAAMILRLHGGISMADAVKLVRQERSALEGKARTSGTKDFWNRGWTDGELESASIEANHRLMKEKKRAEEVERNRIRQERIAQQNHRRPSWASDPNGY